MKRLFHKKKKHKRLSETQQPYHIRQNSNRDRKLDPPGRRRSMPSFTPSAEDSDFSIDPTAAFLGHMSGSMRPTGGGGSTAGMSSSLGQHAPEYRNTSRGQRRAKQGASKTYEDLHQRRHQETKEEEKEPTEFQLNFGMNEFDTSDEDARGEDDDSFGADELLPSMAQMGGPPPTATSAESSISALSNSHNNHYHSATASSSILRQDKMADRKMRGGSSNNHHNNSYSSRYNNSSSSRYNSSQRSTSQRSVSVSNNSSGHGTVDFSRRRYAGTDDEVEDEDTVGYDDGTMDESKLDRAYKNLQEAQTNMVKESAKVKRTGLSRENSPKPRRSTMKDYSLPSMSKIQARQDNSNSNSRPRRSSLTQPKNSPTKQRKKTRRASLGSPSSTSSKNNGNVNEMADELSHSLGEIEQFVRMLHKQDTKTRENIVSESLQRSVGLKQPTDQTAINTSINSGTSSSTRMFLNMNTSNMNTSKSNKFDASMNFNDLQSSVRCDHNSHSSSNIPTQRRHESASDSNVQFNSNNHAEHRMSLSMNDVSHTKNASRRSTVANNSMHLNARAASRFGALENKINKRRHDFSRFNASTTEDLEISQSLNDATRLLAKEGKEGSRRRRRHSIGEIGSGDMLAPASESMSSLQKHSRRSLVALEGRGRNSMTMDDSGSSLAAFQQHQQQLLAWRNNKNGREALPTLLEAQSAHHRHPTKHLSKHPTRTTDLSSKPSSSKCSSSKPRRSVKEQEFLDQYGDDDDQSLDNSMKSSSKRKHRKKRKGSLSPSWRKRLVHSLGGKKKKDRIKDKSAKVIDNGGKSNNRRRRQSIGSSRDLLVSRETRQRRASLEVPRMSDDENPLRRSHTAESHVDHSSRSHATRVKNNEAAFRRSRTGTGIDQRDNAGRGMDNSHNDHRIKTSGRRSNRHRRDASTSRKRTSKGNREKTIDSSGRIPSNNDHLKTDFGEVVGDDEMATVDSSSKRTTSKRNGRSRSLRPNMRTIKNFVGL